MVLRVWHPVRVVTVGRRFGAGGETARAEHVPVYLAPGQECGQPAALALLLRRLRLRQGIGEERQHTCVVLLRELGV